jgi:hypothetical protein
MSKVINSTSEKPTKWEIVYENEYTISTWKYDSKITTNGPVSVEQKYKRGYEPPSTKKKSLGELVKDEKKLKRRKS